MKINLIIALLFSIGIATTGTVTYAETTVNTSPSKIQIVNPLTSTQSVMYSKTNSGDRLSRELMKFTTNEQIALENMTNESKRNGLNYRNSEISAVAKSKKLVG